MVRLIPPGRFPSFRGLTILALLAGLVTAGWALEENGEPAIGLQEILPADVPDGLTGDDFAALDGNWADWSAAAAEDVHRLYHDRSLDLAGQQALLDDLRSRLRTMEKALGDARYASIHEPLSVLHGRLERRVKVAAAALETLALDPQAEHAKRQKRTADRVRAALDALAADLETFPNGSAWLPYVKAADVRAALNDGSDAAGVIRQSLDKLAARESIENEAQRKFLSRDAFVTLEKRLKQQLQAMEYMPDENLHNKLRDELARLVDALEEHEDEPTGSASSEARQAFVALRKLSPDGGAALGAALRQTYFNYNLRLAASEDFLKRFINDTRTDSGPVRDFILGANVGGQQTTRSDIGFDLRPSNNALRFAITLDGVSQSNTAGATDQATIYTSGYHTFVASKEIRFADDAFSTSPAQISVNANNTTTGARTRFSGTLFGGMANRIAMREARSRRGRSEQIAASRVRDRVLPRFNSDVDETFAKATEELNENVFQGWRATGLYPDAMSLRTTDDELRISTRLLDSDELGGDSPAAPPLRAGTAVLMLHETLLSNSAGRINLAGRTMTDEEVRAEIEEFLSKALSRDVQFDAGADPVAAEEEDASGVTVAAAEGAEAEEAVEEEVDTGPKTLIFPESDVVRFRIDDGALNLVLRAAFRQDDGDDIPLQEITVPFTFEMSGDKVHVRRGTVKVAPVERAGSIARQVAQAGVIRKKLQTDLPDRTLERTMTVEQDDREIAIRIASIQAADGWLSITFE